MTRGRFPSVLSQARGREEERDPLRRRRAYETAFGRLAAAMIANCRQRRKARSRTYARVRACVSKMALTAVAGYHIGHLVDLASLLSLSIYLSRSYSFSVSQPARSAPSSCTPRIYIYIYIYARALTLGPPSRQSFPRLSLATKEVSAVANVVPRLRRAVKTLTRRLAIVRKRRGPAPSPRGGSNARWSESRKAPPSASRGEGAR